jgi:hypothetical protein
MSDIFISYTSSDRPRAETLKSWFEEAGWTVWIDRDIDLGEAWEARIKAEVDRARVVVVLWGATARRSDWVIREATAAMASGRLIQIHATGLPLLPPFDALQAVRMQAWSGESGHAERTKLLRAIAERLGTTLPAQLVAERPAERLTLYRPEVVEAIELAFYYCARQLERVRLAKDGGSPDREFGEIGRAFMALRTLLVDDGDAADDRDGVLHRLMDDFLEQLLLLVPDPRALT